MVAKYILFFMILILIFTLYAYRYRNPYKLIMVFGKKGSGKSTLLTKLALRYQKKGRPVYSTEELPGAFKIDPKEIGFYHIPANAVIFIDEVGMIWDNRGFKDFKKEYRDYFKLQRHYKHTVYLFSQAFDIDKKLRDLTDQMYLIKCHFNVLSIARRINKTITIVHADSGGSESRLTDDLEFDSLLLFWAGSIRLTWIPKYVKYFRSFDAPKLKDKEYEKTPFPILPYTNRKEHILYVYRCFCAMCLRHCKSIIRRKQNIKRKVRKKRG